METKRITHTTYNKSLTGGYTMTTIPNKKHEIIIFKDGKIYKFNYVSCEYQGDRWVLKNSNNTLYIK